MPAKARKKRRWLKYILIAASVVIGLSLVGYVVHSRLSSKDNPSDEFEVYKVEKGDITARLTETGTTYLERTIEVMSKISGTVTRTAVEEGDPVTQGQAVAVVEPDNTELLRLYGKRAQVANAYVQMVQAQDDLSHAKRLFDEVQGTSRDSVVRKERALSTATTDFQLALLELHILEKDMEIANGMADKVQRALKAGTEEAIRRTMDASMAVFGGDSGGFAPLSDVRVLAPCSGVVISKGIDVGEMVLSGTSALSRGTVLFLIGDPKLMFISCRVSEVDAGRIVIGQSAKITFEAHPEEKLDGGILWISPIGDKEQGSSIISFRVKIKLSQTPQFVKPGMSCDIDVITSERKDVLRVPLESVAVEDDQKHVYVKKDNEYIKTEIATGIENDTHCEVLSGLEEGQEVITDIDEYEEAKKKQEEAKADKDEKGKSSKRSKAKRRVDS